MKRTLGILLVVISAAAVLSGCGAVGDPAAAKVGTATITQSQLEDELGALADNKAWVDEIGPNFGDVAAPKGGISTKISAAWLSTLMNQYVVDQAFEKRGLTVTAADKEQAKNQVLGLLAGPEISRKFPRWLRDSVTRRQERYAAVAADLPAAPEPTDAELQEYFGRIGEQICPGGAAVLAITVATRAEADAIVGELVGGADFVTLARDRSTDQSTAANGGLAACKGTEQYGQLDAATRAVIDPLAPGATSAPVEIDGAFRIFKVVPWDFEVARPVILRVYAQQAVPPIQKFVSAQLAKVKKIWVDPRYGRLARSKVAVVVYPPTPPDPRTEPEDTSSTTAPATSITP